MAKNRSVRELDQYLSKFAPPDLAEAWDNVGIQVGNLDSNISNVMVSLDVTEPVLWESVEHDCNVIVTHHPLFFRPVSRLDHSTVPIRLAKLAIQMDLNVLSFHTNLDSTREGLNDQLAKVLKLSNLSPLLPSPDRRFPKAGLGRIGRIPKTTLQKLLKSVSQKLSLKEMRFVGDPKHPIRKVAVMTGSGGGFFQEAKASGADVLITGDVKYHHALDALADGMALIDIGHFAGEIGMVKLVAKKIRTWAGKGRSSFKVVEATTQSDPFQFWRGSRK